VLDEENVTASFGVAVFPDDASDAVQLVRNADRALYRAKANGRNRVEVFSLDRRTDDVKASPQAAGVGWTTWSSDEGETSGIRTDQAD
jgi:predicted signal transduction protein with EAL and GGDEF domain